MDNSSLVTYTRISPNRTSPRNHVIDTITIHCFVGQVTAESGCNAKNFVTYNPIKGASCNYVVGYDGSIGLCVEEKDRSWCSSNKANDHRAITIEVACQPYAPYRVTTEAMNALIKLCADICTRNGIKKLLWVGDKKLIGQIDKQNMTVHRWFAAKSCPGDYLFEKHDYIAEQVNILLGADIEDEIAKADREDGNEFKVRVSIDDLNIRVGAGTNYRKTGRYTGKGVFTIVEVKQGKGSKSGWGKLKSGAGWISLDFVQRL